MNTRVKNSIRFLLSLSLLIIFSTRVSHATDELTVFAEQLESSINSRNPYYFNLCFDTEAIIYKVTGESESAFNNEFAEGFIEGVKQEFDPGSSIIDEIGTDGSFTFIRAYRKNEKTKLLFRLISDYGLNYHEYEVEQRGDRIVIVDGYIYISAQTISSTFEQVYTEYLLNIYRYTENRRYNDPCKKIQRLAESGKTLKAYKKWEKLPSLIRYTKSNQLLGINLAKKINKKTYFGTYIEFLEHFPDEPGKFFVSLDGLIEHEYLQAALKNIDILDETIQNDPLLNVLRANIYYKSGNTKGAETCLHQVIESMPEYETGYISLLDIYLEENEFEKATELLDKIVLTFDTVKEDLLPFIENHPDFKDSAEYKSWIDR